MKKIFTLLILSPSAAVAHPGEHQSTGPLHLLTEGDHLALIAAAVAVLGYLLYRRVRP